MKNLIYYPTFEPTNLSWIKYALIYFDKFSPIIPDSGQSTLSDLHWKLSNETDLVERFIPTYQHGDNASTRTIREIEFIQRHPDLYVNKLLNIDISSWIDKRNQRFKLYEEKFNYPFKEYCLRNNFGKECRGGIKLPKELANLFMTFLAEEIAYNENASPITDNPALDSLSTYLRTKDAENENKINAVKTVIDQNLPNRIERIDINKLIEFRNNSGIQELRKKFNRTLDHFYDALENDYDITEYLKSLEKTNKDFIKEIGFFFGGLSSISLGGLILFNNPNTTNLEVIKQIVEGTLFSIGGIIGINQAWRLNTERRQARKFLSKLKGIE